MAATTPVYRTDTLACPLNWGKLAQVRNLVHRLRDTASKEAALQWQMFHRSGWRDFETMARKGWTRPWVQQKTLPAILAQMVMAQVGAALKGHFGNVRNTYTQLVSRSSLSPSVRHQLHSLNRRGLWFATGPVTIQQDRPDPVRPGKLKKTSVVIPEEVMRLARCLIRRALARHRQPHFRHYQFQLDQRVSTVQSAHTAQHPDWLMLSLGDGKTKLALPLQAHPKFIARNLLAGHGQDQAGLILRQAETPLCSASAEIKAKAKAKTKAKPEESTPSGKNLPQSSVKPDRNAHPSRFCIPHTTRLLLSEDGLSLRIGVVSDMRAAFEQQRGSYTPMKPDQVLALDLGLTTLLATDDGELHGRGWMDRLKVLDACLTGIARHRQRLGLRLNTSRRYRAKVQQLRGWLKTEIHRIVNRLVARKRPARIVMEALDFRSPNLSRRLNRLISNFGKGLLTEKMKELEAQFGIVTEYRPAAYTSQECLNCGYIDARNRVSQAKFHCKFCGLTQHADVQGARVLGQRRSLDEPGDTPAQRRHLLLKRVQAFQARHPRPRGGPADPRWTNPYFKGLMHGVRSSGGFGNDPFEVLLASYLKQEQSQDLRVCADRAGSPPGRASDLGRKTGDV